MRASARNSGVLLAGAMLIPTSLAAQSLPASGSSLQATAGTSQSSQTPLAAAGAAGDPAAGEIIVTAQRRSESLEKTPVSVAVVSADTLAKAQVVTQEDLRTQTPGLNIRATTGSNQLNYVIRGESQDGYSDTQPGVLPYVNEVQVSGSGATTAFYDLQSVQVLKGPQGTLFGRSATGGAVLFTTNKPTEELSGYASGTLGNYADEKAEGAISGAIIPDTLKVRLAGIYQSRHGFQQNIYDGTRAGDLERGGGRLSATLQLGKLRNEFTFDYLRTTGTNTTGVPSAITSSASANPPYVPSDLLYGGTANPVAAATGAFVLSAATGAPLSAATAYYNAYFANPLHPNTGLAGQLAAQNARGPYVVDIDAYNFNRSTEIVLSNTTALELASELTLKNIFGFVDEKQNNAQDSDGTPYNVSGNGSKSVPGVPLAAYYHVPSYSDELQLAGKTLANRLDFVVGGYFSSERYFHNQHTSYFDIFFGGVSQLISYTSKSRTLAAYGEGTYKINDSGLSATLGLRYTSERVGSLTSPSASTRVGLGNPAPPGYSYDLSDTFNYLSWHAGVQQQVNSDLLAYVSASRAYRAGGFNGVPPPKIGFADTAGVEFKEERVTAAEAGLKFAGLMADVPVRANIAGFYTWVLNNQRVAYTVVAGSPASLTANVPHAKVYGAEADASVRPARWFTVGLNGSYVYSKFGSDQVFLNGAPQLFDRVPDTPRLTGTIYGDVRIPVGSNLNLLGHADYFHQSTTNISPQSTNLAGTITPSYELLDLRAGIEDRTSRWSLVFNMKNVLNTVYYVGGLPNGIIYAINTLVPGEPRTFTVEARYKF